MTSPYDQAPPSAFWSRTAARRAADEVADFYQPRHRITRADPIATAGSCFAQHVGRTLREQGFKVLDAEPLPPIVPREIAQTWGYGLYSGRYGNIYTIRQMRQLLEEAFADRLPAERVWSGFGAAEGRFFDAQRPGVDPGGLPDAATVLRHRAFHLSRLRELFAQARLLVFTFGLTEAWMSADGATVFPTAPGTLAGEYDPARYRFHNFRFAEMVEDFLAVRSLLRGLAPDYRFLITVSPVPLTATATDQHVEVATSRSKSLLRAVCAELYETLEDVDYFPSYEIITAQAARGSFYRPNLRSVSEEGVATAMGAFLAAQTGEGAVPAAQRAPGTSPGPTPASDEDVICEEMLLERFAGQ